jgi:Arc/MetJ-type ribon-helix-helix transcriptional regulator
MALPTVPIQHNDADYRGQSLNNSKRTGSDSRKQAVSIRMSHSDVRHIKRLAERLGARDSDVIRFAIKLMLAKLAPLQDAAVRGRSLVPVFLESGAELMRHFELDAVRLSGIINEGVEENRRVDPEDIQLIAMSGIQRSYVRLRVAGIQRAKSSHAGNGSRVESGQNGYDHDADASSEDPLEHSLRQYLYEKYLFAIAPRPAGSQGTGT